MTDKSVGLIEKYTVERTDGKLVRWCFVLEDTDPLAVPALRAYADAAEAAGYVALAHDLRAQADSMPIPRLTWSDEPFDDDHDKFVAWAEPR